MKIHILIMFSIFLVDYFFKKTEFSRNDRDVFILGQASIVVWKKHAYMPLKSKKVILFVPGIQKLV